LQLHVKNTLTMPQSSYIVIKTILNKNNSKWTRMVSFNNFSSKKRYNGVREYKYYYQASFNKLF
jgi:hypothetical protein